MTVEAGDVLAELAALAGGAGRADLASEAERVRCDSPRSLGLAAIEGADASRLAAWIARTVPDLVVRIVERAVPSDGLGKLALVLRADRLVDATIQDRFAEMASLAPPAGMAVVVVGAPGEGDLDRLGRGLGRVFLPAMDLAATDLAGHRVFLFDDGVGASHPLMEEALTAFVAWLRGPTVPDAGHRAALGLRVAEALEASATGQTPASDPEVSGARLRALALRVVRQFESEFETTREAIETSLRRLEAEVGAVLRYGDRVSGDRTTPVDVRADLWEAKTHDAVVAMLDRTRGYADGLLRDVPWEALEARAKATGRAGDFKKRLLAAWREVDETPLPHVDEAVRQGLGKTPTTPQAPMAVQAGVGIFGGAIAYFLMGPAIGIGLAVAGVLGVVVGARGMRESAESLAPLFEKVRTQFVENMAAYLDGIRARTTAILGEAADVADLPLPNAAGVNPLLAIRDRLARAVALSLSKP